MVYSFFVYEQLISFYRLFTVGGFHEFKEPVDRPDIQYDIVFVFVLQDCGHSSTP